MCGICGVVNKNGVEPVDRGILSNLVASVRHRGPDDEGIFLEGNLGLGHTRLSIIDLSSKGHQPMEFEDVVISYNGEIYNFQQIRKELETLGHRFQSNSDTEVIIRAYRHWGIESLNRLNGMFAFAIFDRLEKKVLIVRDRFGVKPLYYSSTPSKFVFASTVRAVVYGTGQCAIDPDAVKSYINFLYVPGQQSIFRNIRRLAPGHAILLDLDTGNHNTYRYYKGLIPENANATEPSQAQIEDLLHSAVAYRLVSDVPVGIFLSGGVDSGLVCALAAAQTQQKLKTFSVGYNGAYRYFDETPYALKVARRYNTEHIRFEVDFDKLFTDFDHIVAAMEEPVADTSVFLNFYISKLAREHVKVALSGVGGDELFGGYNRYQAYLIGRKLLALPSAIRGRITAALSAVGTGRIGTLPNLLRAGHKLLSSLDEDPASFYHALISYSNGQSRNMRAGGSDLSSWMKYDIDYYLPDDLLSLTDQMSMANSLEVREPFLDFRLVEMAMDIPAKKKVDLFNKKIGLKKIARKYLDHETIYRRKQGFSAPVGPWLKNQSPDQFRQKFKTSALLDFVPEVYVSSVTDGFFTGNKDLSLQFYSLVVLERWMTINRI